MKDRPKYVYRYAGPVTRFGRVISQWWTAVTTAGSDAEAVRNLSARFREYAGLARNTDIRLEERPYRVEQAAEKQNGSGKQLRIF